jgi:hypothetical protein
MGEEKTIIQNIEENPGIAIGNVQMDKKNINIDQSHASFNNASIGVDLTGAKIENLNLKARINEAWDELAKNFWFVRVKTFKILILSFLICFAAVIYNGIIFIDSDNGFNSFIFGIFGILITLLYFFFYNMFEKEEIKKHKKIRSDYKKLWLKLDLLFIVAIFWVLF